MSGDDDMIARYWSIYREVRPGPLERMDLWANWEAWRTRPFLQGGPMDLTLVLRPYDEQDGRRVVLMFQGVLNFRFIPGGNPPTLHLEVGSIRDRQWEGLHYAVNEIEQDNDFSFVCTSFDVAVTTESV